MKTPPRQQAYGFACWSLAMCAGFGGALALPQTATAFTLSVKDGAGNPVAGYRWLVEEDNTNQPTPGIGTPYALSVDMHKSHAPVVAKGHTSGSMALVDVPMGRRYFVSVLPDAGYTMSGTSVRADQDTVTVIVNAYPVPTAQVSILVFHDVSPINNAPEIPAEQGLPGFTVVIADSAGQQMLDAFGNPLTTTYMMDTNGQPIMDTNGPVVDQVGSGIITTNQFGEALVKYLPPGKFAIQIQPPLGEGWIQTTTIEGTPTIDAWVKANEPPVFVEFGPAAHHVFVGFVQEFDNLAALPQGEGTTGSITGTLVYNHFSPPPALQGFHPGLPVPEGWVGLNEPFSRVGYYVAPADPETGDFTIAGVPAGTYQLVTWDLYLDSLFGFNTITIPDPVQGWNVDLGTVLCFRWFGTYQGSVFYDENENGFRDPGEEGIPGQDAIIRFRDGTIYQVQPTDIYGEWFLNEVFPFFKWLILEVDFLRYKDTGYTNVVDAGGAIPPGVDFPSFGALNPQAQVDSNGVPIINPYTGDNLSRTVNGLGPDLIKGTNDDDGAPGAFLLQAMHLFLGQTNHVDWGKKVYAPGENGGIAGIVYYAVTRAEDEPQFAAAEEWEPGIPRVQINLYRDLLGDGVIDDLDGTAQSRADVDNHPLGWFDDPLNPGAKGAEDVDWNSNGLFDPGDALQIVHTDSFDDNLPTGCIQSLPVIHGVQVNECFDNFGTWNQIRPGVFDGGFAINSYFPGGMANTNGELPGPPPGYYIVEAVPPPGYETVKEEDKNVDYGDEYVPGLRALPPECVGDLHTVPAFLTLFGGIEAPFAGLERPLCDRKSVAHTNGQNTGVEFFMFTEVPKAARAVGFINNDLKAEFNDGSPIFGEKGAPSWLPISFQDYAGNELVRVYCDEFGAYNALLPSTYTVNIPAPSGVSPHMISFIVNHPGPIPDPNNPGQFIVDPYFDPNYSQTPYTFQFEAGRTTYLDTPVLPVAAFAGYPNRTLDVNPPDGSPVIYSVIGSMNGPIACSTGATVTITSLGDTEVPNPDYDPNVPGSTVLITRNYGFGSIPGAVTVDGVPLTIGTWTSNVITATVGPGVSTGRLVVTRGDNGQTTWLGITLHVGGCSSAVEVAPGGAWPATPLQDAIDAANPGDLLLLSPGTYRENAIVYKNVRLQGAGAGSTSINGNPVPFERVTAWHEKLNALILAGDVAPVDAEETAVLFEATEAPCVLVIAKPETFGPDSAGLIDGLAINGGISGGGVYVDSWADYLEVGNNKISNNQGTFGGGITVGEPGLGVEDFEDPAFAGLNNNIAIHHNIIAQNGGINAGGGVTIFRFANNYTVSDNLIIGNFTRNIGAGIAQVGPSDGGLIARNQILFNETFYGGEIGGDGGGIYVGANANVGLAGGAGPPPGVVGDGTGNVSIVGNLIQGNLAGSGEGGGIRADGINGPDVLAATPTATIAFQNNGDYEGTADATIDRYQPATNLGSGETTTWVVNVPGNAEEWTLIKFENLFGPGEGQVPVGARIAEALLILNVVDDGGNAPNVYPVLQPWDEGTVTWDSFGSGPGNAPLAGTDYSATPDATAGVLGAVPGAPGVLEVVTVLDTVQAWADGAPNNGWILQPTGPMGVSIAAREYTAEEALRPVLEISYYTGASDPQAWDELNIFNNIVANNVAALRGGGISLQDAARVNIIHNTIANNDSTATAADAFAPGSLLFSDPQGAGITATPHSPGLAEATFPQTFSDPLLANTIVWNNRAFSWDGTANSFLGALVPEGNWDLQVVGGGTMTPQNCVLSGDPDPLLVAEYQNSLLTASVIDEGGNFISVRYTELDTGYGDYRVDAYSPVKDAGTGIYAASYPALATDVEGEVRPQFDGPDIGADEIAAAITIRPVVLSTPSGLDTSMGEPPASQPLVNMCPSATIVVELWAQQSDASLDPAPLLTGEDGPTGIRGLGLANAVPVNGGQDAGWPLADAGPATLPGDDTEATQGGLRDGLTCVFSDVSYDTVLNNCVGVTPSPEFSSLSSGTCQDGSGLVNEVGGCTFFLDIGIIPQWVRIATITLAPDELGSGQVVNALAASTVSAIAGHGTVPASRIWYMAAPPFATESCLFDQLDPTCMIDTGDFSYIPLCWLHCDTDPEWATYSCAAADFDCSGCVDPGDFSYFVTAWLKPCGHPDIVLPPCQSITGLYLPPADRATVESFGLRYPDGSNPRIRRLEDARSPASDLAPRPRPTAR